MDMKQVDEIRDKLIANKLQHGENTSEYVNGILDMYSRIKELMEKKGSFVYADSTNLKSDVQ